ncbi:MAG: cyclic nucleotide-binding domain-containing protein, partial [Bacteroidota bacterium]
MDKEQIITSIAENYYRLSDDCMEDLATSSKILVLDKGMQLVKEGEYADKIYYVAEGSMRAFYLKDGKDISDWFAFDNDFICSINSYFLNIPSPHYIEVVEPSILLEIHRNQVEKLSDKYLAFDRLGKVILTN